MRCLRSNKINVRMAWGFNLYLCTIVKLYTCSATLGYGEERMVFYQRLLFMNTDKYANSVGHTYKRYVYIES